MLVMPGRKNPSAQTPDIGRWFRRWSETRPASQVDELGFFKRLNSRVGKGITAQAAQGTVRESLPSYGSCYLNQDFIPIFQ